MYNTLHIRMAVITPSTIKTGIYNYQDATPEAKDGGKPRFKVGYITLDNTTDDGDTTTIDIYEKFGMMRFMGIDGWIHTTEDSVVAPEAPTTTVDGFNLTITVGGSTDNKKRFYKIYGL